MLSALSLEGSNRTMPTSKLIWGGLTQYGKVILCVLLSSLLVVPPQVFAQAKQTPRVSPAASESINAYLQKSYADLFEIARERLFTRSEIERMRQSLQQGREYCVNRFKQRSSGYDAKIKQAQSRLKQIDNNSGEAERHTLHCNIQELEALKSQASVMANHAIPIAYDNRQAKLEALG